MHVDIVGLLKPVKNLTDSDFSTYRHSLTWNKRSTRRIGACHWRRITIVTIDGELQSITTAFVDALISRFGISLHVFTGKDSQLETALFSGLSKIIGFHRLRATSCHSHTIGLIERAILKRQSLSGKNLGYQFYLLPFSESEGSVKLLPVYCCSRTQRTSSPKINRHKEIRAYWNNKFTNKYLLKEMQKF